MYSPFTLILLLAALATGGEGSETSLKHLSLEQLGNIEVTTASKEPVKMTRTPAAIYVITQEDIRRSGATSIPEALRLAPGVQVARMDAVKWSVGIRGFGSRLSRAVLVVIDGRNVYSPLSAGVYWEVQDTLLEDVDRIEIVRGPGATVWGPNAVNGVINIVTKRAKDTQGALVSFGGGNEQSFLNFRYGAGNGKNLSYRAYGKAFARGPQFHYARKDFDTWHMGQGGFRADWEPSSRDAVTVQGDLYKGAAGDSNAVAREALAAPVLVQQDNQLSGGNLLGRWRRVLADGSQIQLQTYYDRTRRRAANLAEIRDTFDFDLLHHVTLARRHDFLWGAGARISLGKLPQVVPTIVFTPPNRTDKLYSAFLQDEIQIAENRLWLTLGSKFTRNDFSGFDAQPSARLLWTPGPRQTWWTAVTRAVRTPSDVEESYESNVLALANPLVFLRLGVNRQFRPETLLGYEGGYRNLLTPKLYVDVAAFHNRNDDLLSYEYGALFVETSPPPVHRVLPLTFGNGLYGSTTGFEIAPDWRPATWWQLRGSYSYLFMNLKKRPSSLDVTSIQAIEGSNPHHQVVVTSSLSLPGRLEFSQSYRYVSALPAQRVGSYATADAHLSWRAAPHVEISVVGQNLLQPHHAEFGGNPEGLVGDQAQRLYIHRMATVIDTRCAARLAVLTAATVLPGLPMLEAQGSKPAEYQVKAAYLYNFGRFVEWPDKMAPYRGRSFAVCVLGPDPFGPALDATVTGETIHGAKVVAKRISTPQDAVNCSVLFIGSPEDGRPNLKEILAALDGVSVLTVSDLPEFAQRGGMVQFLLDGNRVRFEVNVPAAERAKLNLSSELLKLAIRVKRNP